MEIAAVPAFRNRSINPYNALLYTGVQQAGANVVEFGPKVLFGPSPDVLHIHWPEWLFSASGVMRARSQAALFRTTISMLRARGTSIVWTVHNVHAHQVHHPLLERQMWDWFTRNIDGWISLSAIVSETITDRYPALQHLPHVVIPHGHYRDVYPVTVTRDSARGQLNIPRETHVIGFVGSIKPYKQVPLLARAFREIKDADTRLLIAGKARSVEHAAIRAVDDDRIIYHPGFVPESQLQIYHRAADLIVLPYQSLQNSGSALMALSFGVPVLVPNLGAMAELKQQVGEGWVHTYDGPLHAEIIREALSQRPPFSMPELSGLDWHQLGEDTVRFFHQVVAKNRRQSTPRRRSRRSKSN